MKFLSAICLENFHTKVNSSLPLPHSPFIFFLLCSFFFMTYCSPHPWQGTAWCQSLCRLEAFHLTVSIQRILEWFGYWGPCHKKDDVQEETNCFFPFFLKSFNGKQPLLLKAEENNKDKINVFSVVLLCATPLFTQTHSNSKFHFNSGLNKCRSRTQPALTALAPRPFLLSPQ